MNKTKMKFTLADLIPMAWLMIAAWSFSQPAQYHDEWILVIAAAIVFAILRSERLISPRGER